MNTLTKVVARIETAGRSQEWFDKLKPTEKKKYLQENPNSKFKAGVAKPTLKAKPATPAAKTAVPDSADKRQFQREFRKLSDGLASRYSETTLTPEDNATIVQHMVKKFNSGGYGTLYLDEGSSKEEEKQVKDNWAALRKELQAHYTAAKGAKGKYKPAAK